MQKKPLLLDTQTFGKFEPVISAQKGVLNKANKHKSGKICHVLLYALSIFPIIKVMNTHCL